MVSELNEKALYFLEKLGLKEKLDTLMGFVWTDANGNLVKNGKIITHAQFVDEMKQAYDILEFVLKKAEESKIYDSEELKIKE